MSDVKVKELKINICKLTPDQIKKETSDDTFDNDNDKNNVSSLDYEFKLFWDAVNNKTDSDDIFTLDYLPFITLQKRTNPSNEMFVVALLSEIIRYLAPNHSEFRSKISYAAFLLQLIVGDSESYSVIDIFHKVELFVLNQNLAWSDDKVREQYLKELTDLSRSKRSPINNDENIFETEHKNDISAMDSDCDDDKDNVFLNIDTQVTISHEAEHLANITQNGVNENNIKLEDETELEDDEMYSFDQDLDPDNQTEFVDEENDEMKNDNQKPKKKWPKKKPIATPCPMCDVVLAFRHQLNRHIKAVHHKIKEFRCNFCKYETYRKCNLKQHIKGVHSYVNIDEIEFIRINQKKTKEDLNHPNSEATVQNDDLEEKIDDDFNDNEFINNSLEVTLEDFSDVQVRLNESAYINPFDNVPNEENLSSHDCNMHFMLEKSKETQPQITSSENSQLDDDTNAIVENGAKAQNLTKQDNNGKVKK